MSDSDKAYKKECADRADKQFQKDYGWGHEACAPAPRLAGSVDRWSYEDIMLGKNNWSTEHMSQKEKNFIKGTPATFKGRRTGSVYSRKK